ncbi:uncharacterized protein LOC120469919 isoform X2 [Pimephales promelas]|uniref:uncharacterized protein LOC120469919 isoform X2 n=1 Tax=Pimephales promelas TaxID=90988 RepID=UPI0019558984|nr:uncharacterized protein LOC120469919 isoform X2 [Pimephales promelas]
MSLLEKIVVIEGHGEDGTEFPFTLPCLFGRKLDCDNRKIELNENNELILTNLSSVNPSRINGHVINQSEQLKHGDLIIDRSFRFDPPPKTLTAGQDKTVQALQEQQEKSTPVHPEKRKSEHSFDTCLRDGSNLPPSVDQSVENDPFSELYQSSSTKKTDIVAKSPWKFEQPKTPLARPHVDHEEAPAADVKCSPEPVTPPELDFKVHECAALPQISFPAGQEEKPAGEMPSVGSVTSSLTEKGVTPVSQKRRNPLKTPQKFSACEIVQQNLSEPQPEEKTPKSLEGRRSVGSQDQSLDLQMPLGQPQTPGSIGKNTEVKMSPRTSIRPNAGKRFQVQGAPYEIRAIPSYRIKGLQVRTAEFIKMRADHDYLFTGDKNSASEAWGEVLKKMGLLGKHTPTEARGKWKYLKKKYKDCIRKGESAKTWQWFALMDKVLGKRHSTNPRFQLASSPEDTPDSSSAEDEEEPRPPPAKRKRGHVDELIEISDESTQSPTQTQANTPQPGSPDSPYVPSLFTPKTSRRTLALERTAEEDQPCVLNGINSKPDEVEHFLLSLAGPLRHLPPRSRSEVKIKFQQILHEAEFNNQENSIRHT